VSVSDGASPLDVVLEQGGTVDPIVHDLGFRFEVALEGQWLREAATANPVVVAALPALPVVHAELLIVAAHVVPVDRGGGKPTASHLFGRAL
jgi:hypothetical protein